MPPSKVQLVETPALGDRVPDGPGKRAAELVAPGLYTSVLSPHELQVWEAELTAREEAMAKREAFATTGADVNGGCSERQQPIFGPRECLFHSMLVVNPIMQRLAAALDDRTMVDFILMRNEIAEDLRQLTTYVIPKTTIDALKLDADNTVTLMILRMNREVIRSLVQHTLGFDFAKPRPNEAVKPPAPKTFSPEYRGAYATSIVINRRNGRFLTKNKILGLLPRIVIT